MTTAAAYLNDAHGKGTSKKVDSCLESDEVSEKVSYTDAQSDKDEAEEGRKAKAGNDDGDQKDYDPEEEHEADSDSDAYYETSNQNSYHP